MRKVRFYISTGYSRDKGWKQIVDGYLDDNCEVAYYSAIGSYDNWSSVLINCGFNIAGSDKRYACVEMTHQKLKKAKQIEKKNKCRELFDAYPLRKKGDAVEVVWSCNHWTDTDHFIDLTTKEGQKILKELKSHKRKKRALPKAKEVTSNERR